MKIISRNMEFVLFYKNKEKYYIFFQCPILNVYINIKLEVLFCENISLLISYKIYYIDIINYNK